MYVYRRIQKKLICVPRRLFYRCCTTTTTGKYHGGRIPPDCISGFSYDIPLGGRCLAVAVTVRGAPTNAYKIIIIISTVLPRTGRRCRRRRRRVGRSERFIYRAGGKKKQTIKL